MWVKRACMPLDIRRIAHNSDNAASVHQRRSLSPSRLAAAFLLKVWSVNRSGLLGFIWLTGKMNADASRCSSRRLIFLHAQCSKRTCQRSSSIAYLLSQKHATVFVPLILPQDQRLSSTFTTTCTHSIHVIASDNGKTVKHKHPTFAGHSYDMLKVWWKISQIW